MLIYSDYLMITCCSSWYSVRIISWPCINNCWYTVIIWWLPAFPADIQSESSVEHVSIICWYTVNWWLPAVSSDIQSGSSVYHVLIVCWSSVDHVLIYSDYMMISCCSSWYSDRIISWPCNNNMLIYSDYLMITCFSCWY